MSKISWLERKRLERIAMVEHKEWEYQKALQRILADTKAGAHTLALLQKKANKRAQKHE